jgi:dTDP-4-amino-4,6-dideoxygalactose transaminase
MIVKSLGFANPAAQFQAHREAIDAAIAQVLEGGVYVEGPAHAAFEKQFASYLGARHVVGVGNGTDALVLALLASGITSGNRVIVPSHTAPATISAVRRIGAVPVFVDVDPSSFVLSVAAVEAALADAKAIVLVHLYGYPADASAMRALADGRGIVLIEDCAQAAGADLNGKRLGTMGHTGCFSFFPTKNLGAIGDGGAVATNDDGIAARLRMLRTYGWDEQRVCMMDGMNSRLDELQAAILSAKLPFLDRDNERRRAIAARYREGLRHLPLQMQAENVAGHHAYHLFVIVTKGRDALRSHLQKDGVEAGIHYSPPNHRHPAFEAFSSRPLPETESLADRVLSLPIYPELADEEVDRVLASVRRHFASQS